MKLVFTVNGPPIGKQRPRWSSKTGAMYTPDKSARYEKLIRQAAYIAVKTYAQEHGVWPVDAEYSITLDVFHRDRRWPDVDNVLKSVLDGLNTVAYLDDKQVSKLVASRNMDKRRPRVEVILEVV